MANAVPLDIPIIEATKPSSDSRIGRFELVGVLIGVLLLIALLTRLALLIFAWRDLRAPGASIWEALAVGEVYDLLASMWLAAPLLLVVALLPARPWRARFVRGWMRAWLFVLFALSAFVVAAELIFFDEFNGRFNFVAVDYLIFPTEVVTNLWESYPLPAILVGVALVGTVLLWLVRRRTARALSATGRIASRLVTVLAYGVVLALLTLTVTPELARVSDDRALNEIALNGYYTFWMAFVGQDAPYEGLYATRPHAAEAARMRNLLAEPNADPTSWSATAPTERRIVSPTGPTRRNVVVVLEESLGSVFVSTLHPRDTALTPRFDSLIAQGTFLTNAYSTGNRTIRALEATTSSLPPLPGISIVRRPASKELFTLPNVLREQGYATTFVYGGRALFDGMGAYMRNNGMDLVVEQKDFPRDAFTTAWGVADEYIFDKVLTTFDSLHSANRPFYGLVLSVSNHKPYSFPAGRISADPDARRRNNAVMYADWALGRFMHQAKAHPWFDSTLFVLMGDHGARVYGASEIPLPSYEIPILFYAPAFMPAGQRVTTLASALDLPPTILAQLGISYETRWFGRDVFAMAPDAGRAPMTHNANIALMQGDRVAVLGLKESTDVYAYDRKAGQLHRMTEPDSAGRSLIEDAIAYFHTADRIYRGGGYRVTRASATPVTPPTVRQLTARSTPAGSATSRVPGSSPR